MITKKTILFLFFILLIISSSCSRNGEEKLNKEAHVASAFLSSVKTVKAASEIQKGTLTLTGQVEYNPDKVINYFPLIGGVVGKVYFSLGDKVQKGQTLFDIKSSDLSALQSEQSSLETEIRVLERELKSSREMFKDEMLSEKELLESESKLKQAKNSLARVRNDMQLFGSDRGNGVFSLASPMTGYIVSKDVASGSNISSDNGSLFTIADLSTVWVIINVYAGNLQLVREGMDVNFTTLSYPDEIFEGKISLLSQVFDPEDKVLKARIVIPNNELKLKPGMSVVVHLKNEIGQKAVSIPSDALIFDNNRYFVVVQETNKDFRVKEVLLQGHNGETSYIQSGLSEGEDVVISNQLLIYSKIHKK